MANRKIRVRVIMRCLWACAVDLGHHIVGLQCSSGKQGSADYTLDSKVLRFQLTGFL